MTLDLGAMVLAWQLLLRCAAVPPHRLVEAANRLYRQGSYRQAESLYRKVFSDTRLRSLAYYNAGNAACQRGEYRLAVSYYETALDLDPKDEDAWHNLEIARRRLNETAAPSTENVALPRNSKDSGRNSLAATAADQLLQQSRNREEQRLRMRSRPSPRLRQGTKRDFFNLSPEELLRQMREQMENGYDYRPGESPGNREEPVPDEVDW